MYFLGNGNSQNHFNLHCIETNCCNNTALSNCSCMCFLMTDKALHYMLYTHTVFILYYFHFEFFKSVTARQNERAVPQCPDVQIKLCT